MRLCVSSKLVLPWLALGLCGCACGRALNDERVTPPYAGLLQRAAGLERAVERVRAEPPGAAALRVQVVSLRAAPGRGGPLLVLVPGVLAGHETWRFLAPRLAEAHDVLLIDPPGTGGSDTPDPRVTPAPAYTPTWLGQHALRAVDRWQRTRGDTRDVVLLAHSLGSSSVLRALADPRTCRELPDLCARVTHLVLFTLPDVLMPRVDPTMEEIARLGDFEADVGLALGALERRVRDSVWESVIDPERRALRGEAERLTAMLGAARTRHAAQAMLRRWRPLDADEQPRLEAARALAAAEAGVDRPTLVIWGGADTTLPVTMAPGVLARLPRARLEVVPDARHSVHQERPLRSAALVERFLAGPSAPPAAASQAPASIPAAPAAPAAPTGLPPPVVRRATPEAGR